MSTHTTMRARLRSALTARVRSYVSSECQGMLSAMMGGMTADSLRESAANLTVSHAEGLAEAENLVTTGLAVLPPLQALTPALTVEAEALKVDLRQAAALPESERLRLIEGALPRLADLVNHVGAEMDRVERLAVAEGLSEGLGELGYTLIRDTGMSTDAIEASRGHTKVLVTVADGGVVETDWVGLSDGACIALGAELKSAAAKHGIELHDTKASVHHDPRGGQKVAAAARRRAESLAHGAVLEAEDTSRRSPSRGLYDKTATGRRNQARG